MSGAEQQPTMIITGAGQPIGRATVEHFHAQGWRVLAIDAAQPEPDLPDGVEFFPVDVSSPEAINAFCAQVEAQLTDGLQALVNCASRHAEKSLMDTSLEEWEQAQAVNLQAPVFLTQGLYPALKNVQGAVVNVIWASSTGPELMSAGTYGPSKGGLLALTRAMAIDFAPDGVRANAVLAGRTTKALLGHPPAPAEVAPAIYFLADARHSGAITGQHIVVDGGAAAQLGTE